ncbi:MAG: hypothetical protein SVY10_08570 [Thermodesulfobacteriota bacterium]|nr:hypothetical protein [Thermodesulfobacteriota bacterium]
MENTESFVSNLLNIEVTEKSDSIHMKWTGKSIDREPAKFLTPILVDLLEKGSDKNIRICLDFRKLDYMNSSTITPVIKILERAKRGKIPITVLYRKSLKWQELTFSALEIFQTKDQTVQIKGM